MSIKIWVNIYSDSDPNFKNKKFIGTISYDIYKSRLSNHNFNFRVSKLNFLILIFYYFQKSLPECEIIEIIGYPEINLKIKDKNLSYLYYRFHFSIKSVSLISPHFYISDTKILADLDYYKKYLFPYSKGLTSSSPFIRIISRWIN